VTWKAGDAVEVAWSVLANHGGGYQYRLCPASEALTEECFHRMPLPFVGQQSLRWDRKIGSRSDAGGVAGRGDASSADSKQIWFDGTYVTNGTVPTGSQWARNPLPRNDHHQTGAGFAPACVEPDDCDVTARCCGIDPMRCRCSGLWGPYNVEIVDKVRVPKGLPAGDYVLGWRWDCEESNQVWMSCSDVAITS